MDWMLGTAPAHKPETETCDRICERFHIVPRLDLDVPRDENIVDLEDDKTKQYEQLQRDVDKLEYEVYSLLNSLRSQESRVEST